MTRRLDSFPIETVSKLTKSLNKAFKGGISGATAMVCQVGSFHNYRRLPCAWQVCYTGNRPKAIIVEKRG